MRLWKAACIYKRSYPSVEADVASIVLTLDKLITSFIENVLGEGNTITFKSSSSRLKNDELALFRLKILGVVQDFLFLMIAAHLLLL